MIKKILKFTGIFLGVITLAVLVYYAKVYISTEKRLHKKYDVQVQSLRHQKGLRIASPGRTTCKDQRMRRLP